MRYKLCVGFVVFIILQVSQANQGEIQVAEIKKLLQIPQRTILKQS